MWNADVGSFGRGPVVVGHTLVGHVLGFSGLDFFGFVLVFADLVCLFVFGFVLAGSFGWLDEYYFVHGLAGLDLGAFVGIALAGVALVGSVGLELVV